MVNAPASPLVHPASLVDAATHHPQLLDLLDLPLDRPLIDYLVGLTRSTVDYAMGRPSTSAGRGRSPDLKRDAKDAAFRAFVEKVLTFSETTVPTVLVALAYISRARPHLRIALEDWALERVFLGGIILASKYANDSSLKNVHWAMCTGVFGRRDVGRIEREFLDVLDFELSITEDDLLAHHDALIPPKPQHQHQFLHHTLRAATKSTFAVATSPAPASPVGSRANPIEVQDEHEDTGIDVEMEDSDSENDAESSYSSDSSPSSSPMPSTPSHTHTHHHHHHHHHPHPAPPQKPTSMPAPLDITHALLAASHGARPLAPSYAHSYSVPAGATFPSHPLAVRPASSAVWI